MLIKHALDPRERFVTRDLVPCLDRGEEPQLPVEVLDQAVDLGWDVGVQPAFEARATLVGLTLLTPRL